MSTYIVCKVTCDLCGLTDMEVTIPERGADQEFMYWMNTVFLPTVGTAHQLNSPNCRPKTLTNVMIPLSDKGVGFKP